ncbi:hypothetical protein [Gloeobacter morelensis]|uniref:Amino acid transporter n=1 Tax=Gloeobacter morelensis MG652769 TaxID=2781736 RepID=A0ABY3PPI5_9CYAN|nr:hypothetical protein [Gloeobacter morelensis]UFP95556.1 hypothetical protein ISF26_04735 [Gloeobacter morelensis MG652769]
MTKTLPLLPVPGSGSGKTPLGRWFKAGGPGGEHHAEKAQPWYAVLWLTGVDYFSTLGYQPGIALLAAGAISPLATLMLVIVTLVGALPVYIQVAKRSYIGQGSIAMLENLLSGWSGKLLVLVLIGFASTSFIITMTLSASDAAEHIVKNPLLEPYLEGFNLPLTLLLLALLAVVFLMGFSEAVGLAVAVGVPYILLNIVVLGRCLMEIAARPELIGRWQGNLLALGDWTGLVLLAALAFPKLALGLSGFETGVSVIPLVKGDPEDRNKPAPEGRIRNARYLLTSAAVLMSGLLISSSFVTTLLIEPAAYRTGGPAAGRSLAYLAHEYLGELFGSIYDVSTIAILWFAGASAMVGLLNLIPRYLPRYGMAPSWVSYNRPLVLVLFAINALVTWLFNANVEAQGGAYATGVLALILSAAVAVALSLGREGQLYRRTRDRLLSIYFWLVAAIFAYALWDNNIERPDGVIIASLFIAFVLAVGLWTRLRRATELRVEQVAFADDLSAELWPKLVGKKVCLVPLISNAPTPRERKATQIRTYYTIRNPFAFLHVNLRDDCSDFTSGLRLQIRQEGENFTIEVFGAVAIANAIAYLSELMDPVSIFLGLTRKNMTEQSLNYILTGQGETGLMVYQILVRYWEWTPGEEDVRPLIFLLSE